MSFRINAWRLQKLGEEAELIIPGEGPIIVMPGGSEVLVGWAEVIFHRGSGTRGMSSDLLFLIRFSISDILC